MLHREVHPWLLQSRYWHRAIAKPRAFAGDYRMAETMYDLEDARVSDPARGAIENCLDRLFATVPGVRAVWERRRVFRDVVLAEAWELDRPVRVLDVGCGGAPYLVDAARAMPDPFRLQITLIDKDPAALVHAEKRLRAAGTQVTALCKNVQCLQLEELPEVEYDVVVSSGLFDYLPDDEAQRLLCVMEAANAPHGIVAICNFSPTDTSRVVNDWVVEWPLIYRDEAAMRAIWPYGPDASVSADGGLLYASRCW
jgi:SAM-dependent methyltransferase